MMAWADLAVCGAGSILWEAALLGLPSVALTMADNQRPIARSLAERGAAISLGIARQVTAAELASAIAQVSRDAPMRRAMSQAGRRAIDGHGARRVVREIRRLAVEIRPARAEDCDLVWHWANDPETRAASYNSQPIPWETHRAWFATKSEAVDCLLLVAHQERGDPVGQVRFDRRGAAAVTSISVAREFRGQGYGRRLIRTATWAAFRRWPGLTCLEAEVKAANVASQRAFQRAGFYPHAIVNRSGVESVVFRFEREPEQG
jgi:RimJ/RimL family protein N-acetyltransferase